MQKCTAPKATWDFHVMPVGKYVKHMSGHCKNRSCKLLYLHFRQTLPQTVKPSPI